MMRALLGVVLIVIVYVAGLNLFMTPVQIRVWNYFSGIDVVVMLASTLPFIITRWRSPSTIRATGVAWWCAAIMAIDVVVFVIAMFFPSGGHPSLESLALIFTGLLRVLLVPVALVALMIAFASGEKLLVVGLGLICVLSQSVYIVPIPHHPLQLLLLRTWIEHHP